MLSNLALNLKVRHYKAVETVGAVYVVSSGVPELRTDHCKVGRCSLTPA